MKFSTQFFLGAVALAVSGCSSPKGGEESPVYVKASDRGAIAFDDSGILPDEYSALRGAISSSQYSGDLSNGEPFTILAVSDETIRSLPPEVLQTTMGADDLDALVGFHVIPGKITSEQLSKLTRLETIGGQRLHVTNWNGEIEITGPGSDLLGVEPARVVFADVTFGNSIVHLLDGFAVPATQSLMGTLENAEGFSMLLTAVKAAGVEGILDGDAPMTLFAPNDEAFAQLEPAQVAHLLDPAHVLQLQAILRGHLVQDRFYEDQFHTGEVQGYFGDALDFTWRASDFFVDGARVLDTDIETTNGVIHVIDSLLVD